MPNTELRWVVRLAEYGNCWLAEWGGDPGRTVCLQSAKTWRRKESARRAAKRAHKLYKWRQIGVVEPVEVMTSIDALRSKEGATTKPTGEAES